MFLHMARYLNVCCKCVAVWYNMKFVHAHNFEALLGVCWNLFSVYSGLRVAVALMDMCYMCVADVL